MRQGRSTRGPASRSCPSRGTYLCEGAEGSLPPGAKGGLAAAKRRRGQRLSSGGCERGRGGGGPAAPRARGSARERHSRFGRRGPGGRALFGAAVVAGRPVAAPRSPSGSPLRKAPAALAAGGFGRVSAASAEHPRRQAARPYRHGSSREHFHALRGIAGTLRDCHFRGRQGRSARTRKVLAHNRAGKQGAPSPSATATQFLIACRKSALLRLAPHETHFVGPRRETP